METYDCEASSWRSALIALPLGRWWSQDAATSIAIDESCLCSARSHGQTAHDLLTSALVIWAVLAGRKAAVTDSVLAIRELPDRPEGSFGAVRRDAEAATREESVTAMKMRWRGETYQPVSRTTAAEAPVAIANTLALSFILVACAWMLFLDDGELKRYSKQKWMTGMKTHM